VDPRTKKKGDKGKRHAAAHPLTIAPSVQPAQGVADAAAIAALAAGQYGEPSKSNFPTIDSVLKPNLLFQMTVSSAHDVNIDGLVAAVQALHLQPSDPPPRLYFVVPPQQFATYQVGTFVSLKGTSASAIPDNVEYWVLQLYSAAETGAGSKRKGRASASSPPPSAKSAAIHVVLPTASVGAPACNCLGPCGAPGAATSCPCRQAGVECHAGCHASLANWPGADPLERHKNCQNHS
jgi:hypothetical protein